MSNVIAVCPGSFDPVTVGHLDIIERAAKLFDRVIVVVMVNSNKNYCFSVEERKEMLRLATTGIKGVEIDSYDGLLSEYTAKVGAKAIVKGLRAVSDFEYEFQMAMTNKKLNPEPETVFLTTSGKNLYLSSSVVKEVAGHGGDITGFVPDCIKQIILQRLNRKDV